MNFREKRLLIAMVILLLVITAKSFLLDPYKPANSEEEAFYDKVEMIQEVSESSWIYKSHLVTTRIVEIEEMTEKEKETKDLDGNVVENKGVYKAKIRKYVLGIIPFSDQTILDVVREE